MKYLAILLCGITIGCTTTTTTLPDGTTIRRVTQDPKAIKALESVGNTLGPIVLDAALRAAQEQAK